jgi:hypothetical protein
MHPQRYQTQESKFKEKSTMEWEHLFTIALPDHQGRRVPVVRVTKEKGSQLPEMRCSYTCCFYDKETNQLQPIVHLPGRHIEAFTQEMVTAVTIMRYGGTTDPDLLAMRVISHGMQPVDPTAQLAPPGAAAKPKRTRFGSSLGEALRRAR